MRAVLEARQKAAAAQVRELEAELERVRAALADAEEVHRCRVIGLEQYYLEALAGEEASADVAGEAPRRKPVGPRRAVPHRRHASEVAELSPDYQALIAAAVDAGGDGLGARRAAVVLGWDSASALPRRRCQGTAEATGGTGLAGRGEAGQVHAAPVAAGARRYWCWTARRRLMSMVIDHKMTASLASVRRS